jgi:hypothetical protein
MSSAIVTSARQALDRFPAGDGSGASAAAVVSPASVASPAAVASPAERAAWADALIDSGELDAAAGQVIAALRVDAQAPETLLTVVRRFTGDHARAVMAAAIDHGRVNAASNDWTPRPSPAGAVAHLAAGSDDAEEALLRAVLVVREYEDHPTAWYRRNRAHRIGEVLTVLAGAHPGEPERLDRWAQILGDADRPRLAAAAALLAPLGLAEIDRRCGGVDDNTAGFEAVPLARALAGSGRMTEALELAARLEPEWRQQALVAVSEVVTDEREARAVVAAFRACPKAGRERGQQRAHRYRLARMLLTFDRIDDALAELTKMRDPRAVGHGPAELAGEIVQWLGRRPGQATGERLRALLDVLESPHVFHQDLGEQVTAILHRLFVLADPALRTEITGTRAAALRAKSRSYERALVDAGLAAGLLTLGRPDEATALLRGAVSAVRGARLHRMAETLIGAAADADLPERDPGLFIEFLGAVADLAFAGPPESTAVAVRLGPVGRATATRLLDRFQKEYVGRWAGWLARAAAETGDFDTLHTLLENAVDEPTALAIGRRLAAALARHGNLTDAHAVADAYGLRLPG